MPGPHNRRIGAVVPPVVQGWGRIGSGAAVCRADALVLGKGIAIALDHWQVCVDPDQLPRSDRIELHPCIEALRQAGAAVAEAWDDSHLQAAAGRCRTPLPAARYKRAVSRASFLFIRPKRAPTLWSDDLSAADPQEPCRGDQACSSAFALASAGPGAGAAPYAVKSLFLTEGRMMLA